MMKNVLILLLLPVLLAGCATALPPSPEGCDYLDRGLASWYGNELRGHHTANGEMFDPDGITAAHRTLPFGSIVKVVKDKPGADPKGVFVRINDRGPFVRGRIIDISWGAAKELGMMDTQPVIIYNCR